MGLVMEQQHWGTKGNATGKLDLQPPTCPTAAAQDGKTSAQRGKVTLSLPPPALQLP